MVSFFAVVKPSDCKIDSTLFLSSLLCANIFRMLKSKMEGCKCVFCQRLMDLCTYFLTGMFPALSLIKLSLVYALNRYILVVPLIWFKLYAKLNSESVHSLAISLLVQQKFIKVIFTKSLAQQTVTVFSSSVSCDPIVTICLSFGSWNKWKRYRQIHFRLLEADCDIQAVRGDVLLIYWSVLHCVGTRYITLHYLFI